MKLGQLCKKCSFQVMRTEKQRNRICVNRLLIVLIVVLIPVQVYPVDEAREVSEWLWSNFDCSVRRTDLLDTNFSLKDKSEGGETHLQVPTFWNESETNHKIHKNLISKKCIQITFFTRKFRLTTHRRTFVNFNRPQNENESKSWKRKLNEKPLNIHWHLGKNGRTTKGDELKKIARSTVDF